MQRKNLVVAAAVTMFAVGCNSDEIPEGDQNADDGIDGTGDGCLLDPEEDKDASRYQCEGNLSFTFEAEVPLAPEQECPNDICSSSGVFVFGEPFSDDSYWPPEGPKVMACCGEEESEFNYWKACMWDAVAQGCREVYLQLDREVNNNMGQLGNNQLANLRDHVKANLGTCSDEFWEASGLKTRTEGQGIDDDILDGITWDIGNDAIKWPSINDPSVTLDQLRIDGVYAPDPTDECESSRDNDNINFTGEQEGSGLPIYTLAEGTLGLHGYPSNYEGDVELESADTSCDETCSELTYSVGAGGTVTLETMNLYSAAAATVTDGSSTYVADYLVVKLLQPVTMTYYGSTYHYATTGKVEFTMSAVVDGAPHVLATTPTNYGSLWLDLGWYELDTWSFNIHYTDSLGEQWNASFPAMFWEAEPPT